MLMEDTDWFANDGNEEVTHDWTNAVQRSVDAVKASAADGTFPVQEEGGLPTTLPWGGGKIMYWALEAGVGPGAKVDIDTSFDWRNRIFTILAGGAYNAANKLPGGAAYSGSASMSFDYAFTIGTHYTEDGATDGDPPAGGANYWELIAGDLYIFSDSTDSGHLKLRNGTGATTYYPLLVLWVSDQFPTRSP